MAQSVIGMAAAAGRRLANVARRAARAGEARKPASRRLATYIIGDERIAATRRYLEFAILPLWFLSGVADYICHRQSKIDTTSGVKESAIHSLLIVESAVPVVMGLLFDINAGVIATMLAAFAAHQATAIWDVGYAVQRRVISPTEQHIHGALEMVPFCALSLLVCLHWDQFRALFGIGEEPAETRIRWKTPSLPRTYVGGIMTTTGVVGLLYSEELLRCIDAYRKGLSGVNSPPQARELYDSTRAR